MSFRLRLFRRAPHLEHDVDDVGEIIGARRRVLRRRPRVRNVIRRRRAVELSGRSREVVFGLLIDVLGHSQYKEQKER
ncbi:hypothetical protein [Mesorhizobium sp. M8A.F.Ca.ET.165.01.1.1]|uniref:hypothetical protein n=1 Tax=Mesorhizobium sp. M8A.F.Ca.ET.165.01.1.1 TaxID=2563960 RepID=UPI001678C60D|nr:hypothetical protein [Mesorhizobium sp. M8A.F.Ca.ET.165.01.1.1]